MKVKLSISLIGFGLMFLLIIPFSSCRKDVIDTDSNYIGTWLTDTIYLVDSGSVHHELHFSAIGGEYHIYYHRTILNHTMYSGKAKVNSKGTQLLIGNRSKVSLRIQEPPRFNSDSTWSIVVDDNKYLKQ